MRVPETIADVPVTPASTPASPFVPPSIAASLVWPPSSVGPESGVSGGDDDDEDPQASTARVVRRMRVKPSVDLSRRILSLMQHVRDCDSPLKWGTRRTAFKRARCRFGDRLEARLRKRCARSDREK